MSQITRRNAVLTAAAAGAAFGLDKPLGGFIGSAEAQKAPVSITEKGYAKFKVGDVEVIQVYDGMFNKPHDAAFIKNASIDDTKAALKKAGLKDDAVPITFTVTFVRTKGKLVMFDSSTGGQLAPTAGLMMAKNMYAAGIDPQKISTIVVTHFHGDHILGMISKETNSRVFPDAEIVVPAAELKYWNDPALPGKAPDSQKGVINKIQATLGKWKNVRQVEDGKDVMPGIKAIATPGHTPGHTSYLVGSGKSPLLVGGDLTNIPSLFLANPGWHVSFDMDAAMAEAGRRKMFDRAISEKLTVTGYHWGLPGAGTIKKDGNGYAFVPVKV